MHAHSIDDWRHEHVFLGADHERNERRSWAVVALCGAMMTAEIVGGWLTGSMALVADGLHMSTHAGAWSSPPAPMPMRGGTHATSVSRSAPASSASWRRFRARSCWR
jgi:hypothetical protein